MIFTQEDRAFALDLFERVRIETAASGGGVTRPSYGDMETAAIRQVAYAAGRAGLAANPDDCGNLIMSDGVRPQRSIWIGSHMDSVPHGGNYDGLAGVVAALLVLKKAKEQGLQRPITGVGLRGEESAWFGVPHVGAKALLGKLPKTDLERSRGVNTLTIAQGMRDCGVPHASIARIEHGTPFVTKDNVEAWWELHIEQGPVLAVENIPVGLVTSVWGSVRAPQAVMRGEAGHSGTTPHDMRHDAVMKFVDLMSALEMRRAALMMDGHELRFTCGMLGTNPDKHALTAIADEVQFSLDVRSGSLALMTDFYTFASMYAGTDLVLGDMVTTMPCSLSAATYAMSADAANKLGVTVAQMPSGAGHDATVFESADIPAGMIFVRNQNGSHNPDEAMDIDDFMLGVEVLYGAISA